MAFSPCPRCQDKETFDDMLDPTSCVQAEVGFVTERAVDSTDSRRFRCTQSSQHVWGSLNQLVSELHHAGYGVAK